MQLASHDSSADNNSITWLINQCLTQFWTFWSKECNGDIYNIVGTCLDILGVFSV